MRGGKDCVARTCIGLDVLIYDVQKSETTEGILQTYPSIGSLTKHTEHHLRDQEAL